MWKLQILLYSFLIPKEFNVLIDSLSLSPYRLLLILLFPWVFKQLILKRNFNWQHHDTLAVAIAVWPSIALAFNTNISVSIESGGILFLETFTPFFLARLCITKYDHLVVISKTLLWVATIMAAVAIPEAITGRPIAREISSLLTGNPFTYIPEQRFGIWRSLSFADHPIIMGTICASALPIGLALFQRKKKYGALTGVSFLGVISSASSGPILSIVAQFSLQVWARLTRGRKYKWWLLFIAIGSLYILIDVLSNRDPFRVMFTYLLFNEHNGYVRYSMWSNSLFLAVQSVESFMVGYGFSTEMMSLLENSFWTRLMSASVDSYWMVILLRYGAPILFLSAAMIILTFRANIRNYRKHKLRRQRTLIQAWLFSAASLSLVACTVHFWGSTASLFFIILGVTSMDNIKDSSRSIATTALRSKHERNSKQRISRFNVP